MKREVGAAGAVDPHLQAEEISQVSRADHRTPSRSRTATSDGFAQFRHDDGSGAPAARLLLAFLALALCALGFGVAGASAEAPQLTTPQVSEVSYASAHVKAEVDPKGEGTSWFFEVSTDGINWERTNVEGFVEGSGLRQVGDEDITSLNFGESNLKPGTTYQVRLSASNESGFASSSEPNPEFTTKSLPAPSVSIDPVTNFAGTTATFSGEINPNAPAGNPEAANVDWHFQCSPECPNVNIDSSPTPNPISADASSHVVSGEATGLEPNTTYEVTLVGKNAGDPIEAGPVTFKTDAIAPDALTIPAFVLEGGTSALVGARVNPHNTATTWWIEYGTTENYGQSVPVSEDAAAGSGGQYKFLTQALGGLSLGTTYHFRVTAKNATGEVHGEDRTFTTPPPAGSPASCPNEAFRTRASANLPDCRAYESVNPVNLQGDRTFVPTVADNGEAALWESIAVLPGMDSTGVLNTYLAKRTASGWISTIISPPATLVRSFYGGGEDGPVTFLPNLDGPFIWSLFDASNPEDPDDTGKPNAFFSDIYRREPDGSFVWLNRGGAPATFDDISYIGATPDQMTVFFTSSRQYEPDAPNGGLYIRSGETTSIVKDENGDPLTLMNFTNTRPMPSADGSVIGIVNFNEGTQREQLYLYQRDLGHAVFVTSAPIVRFQLMSISPDGSKVFFATSEQLVAGDVDSSTDIYEYEVGTGTFRSLTSTAAGTGNGSADVEPIRTYPADFFRTGYLMSADGSTVYFTSTEQLDGTKGISGERNLYRAEGGSIHYVVTLSGELQKTQLSGDGKTALFVSADRLTAYDNAEHTEIYAYNSSDGTTVCVSCRPDGVAPESDSNFGGAQVAGARNLVRNSDLHGERIFFQSTDALLPEDTNGAADVYEYTASSDAVSLISTGESVDDSLYAGNSVDGRDVFFTTTESLLPNDFNVGTSKLFDARIGGGFPDPPPPPAACEGEGCRGAGSANPAEVAPTSPSFVGPGNPKHKHKKHRHKKHKHKKHRHKKHKHRSHKKHQSKSNQRDANRTGRTGR
jgi:WD40-like Beta Propeller Repeat